MSLLFPNLQQDANGNFQPWDRPLPQEITGTLGRVIVNYGSPVGVIKNLPQTVCFDFQNFLLWGTADGTTWVQLGGGTASAVTKLLAGANISLSPATGIGDVTITGTGGSGGANYNLAGTVNPASPPPDPTQIYQYKNITTRNSFWWIPGDAAWE